MDARPGRTTLRGGEVELLALVAIGWQAGWCARAVDARQPIARWGSVGALFLSWVAHVAGLYAVSAVLVVIGWLIFGYAMRAKAIWAKKRSANG